MADNITAPASGAVLATDDIGGVHFPRSKVVFGADGAATDVSAAAPLPVLASLVGTEYETVAAGQNNQPLGAAGAAGDLLAGLLIVPASTSPGPVTIQDGSGAAITVFAGGANSLTTLHPFMVPLGIRATGAGWKVSTGSNVTAIGVGDFT